MSRGRGVKAETAPEPEPTILTYREKLHTKQFKSVFIPDGKIVEVNVKSCVWRSELANTIQLATQIGSNFYLAVEFQDEEMPWLRYGFLKQNIEIPNYIEDFPLISIIEN